MNMLDLTPLGPDSFEGLQIDCKDEESISSALESATRNIVEWSNARNLYHWADYVARDFQSTTNHQPFPTSTLNCGEHIKGLAELIAKFPEYHLTVLSCSANLDLIKRFADVYMDLEVTGAPVGITRPSVAVCEWRLRGGRWFVVRYTTMRGSPSIVPPG